MKENCPFCFQKYLVIRFDKKNRPYFKCEMCSHRIFVHSSFALVGVLGWCKALDMLDKEEVLGLMERGRAHLRNMRGIVPELNEYLVKREEVQNV